VLFTAQLFRNPILDSISNEFEVFRDLGSTAAPAAQVHPEPLVDSQLKIESIPCYLLIPSAEKTGPNQGRPKAPTILGAGASRMVAGFHPSGVYRGWPLGSLKML